MHPILFRIGSFELFTYGLMMAVGVLSSLFFMTIEAKRFHLDSDKVTRLVVWTFLAGLIGSRVMYVVTRLSDPGLDFWAVLFNLRAGFVYYGGLIASWLYLIWWVKKNRAPFWPVMDMNALGICIGLGVGRIGCLLGGCCFGSPTTLPWGVIMEKEEALGHLHPVQAYEALFLFVLFALMWARRKHKAYEGEFVVWFVGLYAIVRFLLEYIRGDLIRGFLIEDYLSTSQFLSIPMLVLAIVLHFKLSQKRSSA
jgi:phosphatidylglycerol:prolipoprotein diacylglycerol transferase